MAGFRVEGNTSGNVAEVTSANELKTALSLVPANIGGVRLFSENDAAVNYLKSPETSVDYRLRVGMDTILFTDSFNGASGAVANSNHWQTTIATQTLTTTGSGTIAWNVSTTAAQGAMTRTYQYFPLMGTNALSVEFAAGIFTGALVANEIWLMGFGIPSVATTAPTDGIWFQITASGVIGVVNNNGTTVQTGTLKTIDQLAIGSIYKFAIVASESEIEFWLNDELLTDMLVPAASSLPFLSTSLPIFTQKYNSGTATGAVATPRVGNITVSMLDVSTTKPWAHQQAGAGLNAYCIPTPATGIAVKGTTWANTAAPTAAALTNTTALVATLGGIAAVLPTLTAATDGIVFSYLNPLSTINITGRNLYITGVRVQGVVSVVLAGGPVIYTYAVAYGHLGISLATTAADTALLHTQRIAPIGIESYATTAAVGVMGSQGLELSLDTPIVVRPGEYIQLIAKNIGTVTTTGAITMTCNFNGYFE